MQSVSIRVETEKGTYSQDNLIRVRWVKVSRGLASVNGQSWEARIIGNAPYVVLPGGAVIVATLEGEDKFGLSRLLVDLLRPDQDVAAVPPREEVVAKVAQASDLFAEVTSPRHAFPAILGFEDSMRPDSAFLVSPRDPATRRLGVRKVSVTVRKAADGVPGIGVTKELPWLEGATVPVVSARDEDGKIRKYGVKSFIGE